MNTGFADQPTLQKKRLKSKIEKIEQTRHNTQADKGHLKRFERGGG
jgi:hypothetical protein